MSSQAVVQAQQKTAVTSSNKGNILQRAAVVPEITAVHSGILQRCSGGVECAECRQKRLEREGMLQRAAVNAAPVNENGGGVPPVVHEVLGSSGQALDTATREFMEPRFGFDFSGVRVHTGEPPAIQTKLTMSRPGDTYEQEAEQVSETIMRMPTLYTREARLQLPEEMTILQAREYPNHILESTPVVQTYSPDLQDEGYPLPQPVRAFFEPRFGYNFSHVRVHTDERAAELADAVHAQAFTLGRNIVFGVGQYKPETSEGKTLLAHELTHVVQQGNTPANGVKHAHAAPGIQRRLIAFGTLADVNALLTLIGPRAGLTLTVNVMNNQVQITAILPGVPPSPALRTQLTTIINHATQHAEVVVSRGQAAIRIGGFPQPADLTVTKVQRIDIDDMLAIEAGAPGSGVAKAAHEIEENFRAHGMPVVAGTERFHAAHQQAIRQESAVASQLVMPGHRVADAEVMISPTTTTVVQDFESYYLVFTSSTNAGTRSQDIIGAHRAPRLPVSAHTIAGFTSSAVPPTGPATIAAAAASILANPTSTVLVEGFTDSTGSAAGNVTISRHRAEHVRDALVAAGVGPGRIHVEGRGAILGPTNATPVGRSANRRVDITVTRPGP